MRREQLALLGRLRRLGFLGRFRDILYRLIDTALRFDATESSVFGFVAHGTQSYDFARRFTS
jgi:hypothetical protein